MRYSGRGQRVSSSLSALQVRVSPARPLSAGVRSYRIMGGASVPWKDAGGSHQGLQDEVSHLSRYLASSPIRRDFITLEALIFLSYFEQDQPILIPPPILRATPMMPFRSASHYLVLASNHALQRTRTAGFKFAKRFTGSCLPGAPAERRR